MDLGNWLRSLDLERYEAAFRDNAIDETILRDLTEAHLRELDLPFVARIKLLKAIAALPGKAALHLSRACQLPAHLAILPSTDRGDGDVQRSHRFDGVINPHGSGGFALAHLGLTEMRSRNRAPLRRLRREIYGRWRVGLFWLSQAHEDDAERAVRSALEMVAEIAKLKTHAPLQTRVGIATGLVVGGDLIGSGEAQERGIVGGTPNLAGRLQGLPSPTWWSSQTPQGSFSAICLSCGTLAPGNSRVLKAPYRFGVATIFHDELDPGFARCG
jgi:SAM domain (Sterile alpha motif)/Adenylate and Guanylate cyclase catalytic domain